MIACFMHNINLVCFSMRILNIQYLSLSISVGSHNVTKLTFCHSLKWRYLHVHSFLPTFIPKLCFKTNHSNKNSLFLKTCIVLNQLLQTQLDLIFQLPFLKITILYAQQDICHFLIGLLCLCPSIQCSYHLTISHILQNFIHFSKSNLNMLASVHFIQFSLFTLVTLLKLDTDQYKK